MANSHLLEEMAGDDLVAGSADFNDIHSHVGVCDFRPQFVCTEPIFHNNVSIKTMNSYIYRHRSTLEQ